MKEFALFQAMKVRENRRPKRSGARGGGGGRSSRHSGHEVCLVSAVKSDGAEKGKIEVLSLGTSAVVVYPGPPP